MNGRGFDTPRGARAMGRGVDEIIARFALAKVNGGPLRPDLLLNPDTLKTQGNTAEESIQDTADGTQFGDFAHIPILVGVGGLVAPILTRPPNKRTILIIQNRHPTQELYVGFGIVPSANNGLVIDPKGSVTLDVRVPQNDVFVVGQGAATNGTLTYCNQDYGRR